MKLLLALFLISNSLYAVVPLDMELGYWEYKTELASNPMLKQAMAGLAKLPKAQREQIMKKLGGAGGVQKFYKCYTKEDRKKFVKSLMKLKDTDGCKMIVKKSTKSVYKATRKCSNGEGNIELSFNMASNKKGTSIVTMPMSPKPIKSKLTWISSNCPKKK